MLKPSRPRVAQALVEFALILPLVIGISLGAVQVVLYAHARDLVMSAAQEGARLAAEDGRTLDEGYARARELIAAGLGTSVDSLEVAGGMDTELVLIRIDGRVPSILPMLASLPVHSEARVARERFRPGGR